MLRERVVSLVGLLVMVGIAYLLSDSKEKVNKKTILTGIGLQLLFGFLILKTPWGKSSFEWIKQFFVQILDFTNAGSDFVFGGLKDFQKVGFVFATFVLPTIIFMSALMSVLYHIGLMQILIKGVAWVMVRIMGTSGAESLAAAANIFAGQTEAPLVVKPYLGKMTRSELMALMTGGMATVAGGVLAAYVGMGIDAGHLLAASVMSAPAALVCAKLLVPETEESVTKGNISFQLPKTSTNVIDAAATGASEGLKLSLNVAAMLLAFIALIAMCNGILGWVGGWVGHPDVTLEFLLGYLFAPVAWLLGVPWNWDECLKVGTLLGQKLVLNEFVAYTGLQKMINTPGGLSERSINISIYALCGFANFSSIAIQVGGIGSLAPDRRKEFAKLGMKCLLGGTLACLMTACIAGIMI